MRCDRCTTCFKDVDELARHKQSHETSKTDDEATRSYNSTNHGLQESQDDNQRAPTINVAEGSNEEDRTQEGVVQGQRNDLTNDLANRATIDNYRDGNEWDVNPDQTPKQAKTIRPIPYV